MAETRMGKGKGVRQKIVLGYKHGERGWGGEGRAHRHFRGKNRTPSPLPFPFWKEERGRGECKDDANSCSRKGKK